MATEKRRSFPSHFHLHTRHLPVGGFGRIVGRPNGGRPNGGRPNGGRPNGGRPNDGRPKWPLIGGFPKRFSFGAV